MDMTRLARHLLESTPSNRSLGLKVQDASDARSTVSMPVPQDPASESRLASGGLVALSDATGLAAIIAAADGEEELAGVAPTITAAEFAFHAPAQGSLLGCSALDDAARVSARSLLDGRSGRTRLVTVIAITDGHADLVCSARLAWSLQRGDRQRPLGGDGPTALRASTRVADRDRRLRPVAPGR